MRGALTSAIPPCQWFCRDRYEYRSRGVSDLADGTGSTGIRRPAQVEMITSADLPLIDTVHFTADSYFQISQRFGVARLEFGTH